MKFLVDVCAGTRLAAWLRELGHEVAEVRCADCRMTDDEILQWGEKEGRAVITLDKDFGHLSVAAGKARTSIIRLPDVPVERRKELLALVLAKHAEDLENGSVITVTESRIRVRRLP